MKLITYLNFGGNCAEAFHFYEEHLGGKILNSMKHGESPVAEHRQPGWEDKVLNATLQLGETVLMGADIPPNLFQPMRSVYMTLMIDTKEETERIYKILIDGGEILMPLSEQLFAGAFAQCRDRFGVNWMLLGAMKQS
ncbi:VOC family protein [Granulicella sp. S156]|uniref:VOC family protein n=1 Tax=Granulicella sp. S156 TaxID=1747224 RepID=UPI00131B98C5|nr:VOC family protein [Granulicella sp. S156]